MNLNVKLILLLLAFNEVINVEIEFDIVQVPRYYTPLRDDIFIAGSFNNWSPNHSRYKFNRLSNNLFKLVIDLPQGDHEYKFTRGTWSSGEANSNGDFMANRILKISSNNRQTHLVRIQNWDDFKGGHTATGNVFILSNNFPYRQFNTTKPVWIYLPPDYFSSLKSYPVLYMHDGQNLFDNATSSYGDEWNVDETVERNYFFGKQTAIVVGLQTKDQRTDELTPYTHPVRGGGKGDRYVDFLKNDVKPYVDRNFRTKPGREFTGLGGSSFGGLMTFYAGMKNQNLFSKLVVFSPSFWFNSTVFELVDSPEVTKYDDTKLYFVCGGMEGDRNMTSNMLKMADILSNKGYTNLAYFVRPDGIHYETFWSQEFPSAFNWLFN
ncbi:T9SS C-terminal target domain-containing [Brachionus plicatilis]|uniref:T9SS C-terminal target domain-containing n=1 Tax=Brachionus plicatilis TaxID=10195 RepID=A0A3M7PRG9_BRAPC|nr:T9SS C-terminal target domain-containing [Brachionus plicatilis]